VRAAGAISFDTQIGTDQRKWKSAGRQKRLSSERARAAARRQERDTCAHIGRIIIKYRARIASQPASAHASLGPQRNVNKTHASSVKIPDACLSKSEKEMSNLTNYTSPQHASTKGADRMSSLAQKNPNTYHSLEKEEKWRRQGEISSPRVPKE
jgi:hypothetical protein